MKEDIANTTSAIPDPKTTVQGKPMSSLFRRFQVLDKRTKKKNPKLLKKFKELR